MVLSISKGHSDAPMESLRSAVGRSWGVEATQAHIDGHGAPFIMAVQDSAHLHLSSPLGYYIPPFSCIFIDINLSCSLALCFSGADYPHNIAMSRTDVCAGQLLVKMG